MSTRGNDEVDRVAVRHVADDSFESWFAARMNRSRNEERNINIGGNITLSDDKPGMSYKKYIIHEKREIRYVSVSFFISIFFLFT